MFWLLDKLFKIFNPPREVIDDKLKRKIQERRAKNREARPEVEPQPTYTIWFQDGGGRQEYLTEDQMRKAAVRYDFDAKTVISEGETLMTEDHGETVVGGCFKTN